MYLTIRVRIRIRNYAVKRSHLTLAPREMTGARVDQSN